MIGDAKEHPFERYLNTENALNQVTQMINDEEKSFNLNLLDYWDKCEEGATKLLNNGYNEITELQTILKSRLAWDHLPRIIIVNHLQQTKIREINYRHIGKFIATTAMVTSIMEPSTILTTAVYYCDSCNEETEIDITGQFMPPQPTCSKCSGKTTLDPMKGEKKTIQWITVQELFEDTPSSSTPVSMKVMLEEDLIGLANPGSMITLISVVKARRKKPNDANPDVDLYLEVNNLKSESDQRLDVKLTEADINNLKQMVSEGGYLEKLMRSIAPTLYGLENEKLSIALQQCGGNIIEIDGEYKRGSIHVLLAGDAGEGKSKVLDWAVKMSPRNIKTVGPGATNAGLTAATIKDEDTGRYTLVAGAMILADGGLVAADEFDKMRKEDRGAMHSAMEEQTVNINKGGFNASMRSRCSILAACNPYGGQWNTSQTLLENIKNFPPALVTRFDLIWILINNRTVNEEMIRVRHVLKNRFHTGEVQPPYNLETLRKLFVYAKTITPKVSLEAENRIEGFYEEVLKAGKKTDSTLMTMRMLEGIARLTEASAKLHLREEATVEDAELVIRLMKESLLQSGIDPITGLVDASLLETGISSTLRGKMESYLATLRQVGNMSIDHLVKEEDIESALIDKGFKAEEVKKIRDILMRDSTIFSPRPHFIKAV